MPNIHSRKSKRKEHKISILHYAPSVRQASGMADYNSDLQFAQVGFDLIDFRLLSIYF